MKRHLIFCIALVAVMASCVKEPQIYRRLTEEEAAIVPYQIGQTIRMLNQDNDTLCFTVVHDTTFVSNDRYDPRYNPSEKMSIEPRPYFYAREVVLQSPPEDSCLLRYIVVPDKEVSVSYEKRRLAHDNQENFYYWHAIMGRTLPLNDLPTTTFTIGATTYENVHVDQGSYMADTTNISYAWYYSEQLGLLAAKHGDNSLTLIP